MSIKILHASDFHMDSPFDSLPAEKAQERRREGRLLLDRISQIAEEEKVQLILLSGDLLDSSVSYFETQETMMRFFENTRAEIFISPGNHDYYCLKSPYTSMKIPDHVHIFTSPIIKSVELPELGCRVWGAGFNAPFCPSLLTGFQVPRSDLIDIMVLHGNLGGDQYNPISEADIAFSNIDYMALGHIHTFSGIKRAGNTVYAYPGCPEGRGFDELGEKGIIIGDLSKAECDLRFFPLEGRKYKIIKCNLTECKNVDDIITMITNQNAQQDIVRIILSGSFDGDLDTTEITEKVLDSFYHITVQNESHPRRNIWAEAEDDTLKGRFLARLLEKYKAADEAEKHKIVLAVQYGLAALENREELHI